MRQCMKFFTIILLSLISFHFSHAQVSEERAYEKGDFMLSLGVGALDHVDWPNLNTVIPFVINADYGLHPYVSLGGYVGYTSFKPKWDDDKFTQLSLGVRCSFHFWQMIDEKTDANIPADKLDLYLTTWGGLVQRKIHNPGREWKDGTSFGGQLGARYFFIPNLGLFGEFGLTPTSYLNFGATVRF